LCASPGLTLSRRERRHVSRESQRAHLSYTLFASALATAAPGPLGKHFGSLAPPPARSLPLSPFSPSRRNLSLFSASVAFSVRPIDQLPNFCRRRRRAGSSLPLHPSASRPQAHRTTSYSPLVHHHSRAFRFAQLVPPRQSIFFSSFPLAVSLSCYRISIGLGLPSQPPSIKHSIVLLALSVFALFPRA